MKGDVYVFGGYDNYGNWIMSVEKYSPSINTWNTISDMVDDRTNFCVCSYMDKIFVIGGKKGIYRITSCLQFNTNDNSWKEVAGMKVPRSHAACAVFEGNIIVSGGMNMIGNSLRTVESYDVIADEWSPMPNMIKSKSLHSLVVVKNKLYVIGIVGDTCEVFDNCNKNFVAIKSPSTRCLCLNQAISIGSKLFAFQNDRSSTFCYDVDEDEEQCDVTNDIKYFSCVKVPGL